MVNQFAAVRTVFIDDGEGGRVDDVLHAEAFAYGFGEGGLTGSHLAVHGKDGVVAHGCDKFPGSLVDVV